MDFLGASMILVALVQGALWPRVSCGAELLAGRRRQRLRRHQAV